MAIELPPFEDTFCQILSLCSRVSEEPAKQLPQEDLDLTASYKASPGKALVRLIWDREEFPHFHVDVALQSAFFGKPPKADTRLPGFRKAFAVFNGAMVRASIHGYFVIPLASIPPTGGLIFSGTSAIRLRASKSEIELTGASLTFRHSDIDRIRWELAKDTVFLDVYARREVPISDRYVIDAFQRVHAAVDRYVLGKKVDDKASV